jgi:hypothetical protein
MKKYDKLMHRYLQFISSARHTNVCRGTWYLYKSFQRTHINIMYRYTLVFCHKMPKERRCWIFMEAQSTKTMYCCLFMQQISSLEGDGSLQLTLVEDKHLMLSSGSQIRVRPLITVVPFVSREFQSLGH